MQNKQPFDQQIIETASTKLPVSQTDLYFDDDLGFPDGETCEVKDLGVYAQHLEQTPRHKAIWKIPMKDWNHLKEATIFGILTK